VLIALAVAGVTEYLQAFAPDRHPSLGDFLSNCIGALLIANAVRYRTKVALTPNPAPKGRGA
jgi:VanZ family protein